MIDRILVATWNWFPGTEVAWNVEDRLRALEEAVLNTQIALDQKTQRGTVEAVGLVRAIFIAPEHFFTAPLASLNPMGKSLPLYELNIILGRLRTLSARYPRILIVPGTVSWRHPIDIQRIREQAQLYLKISERLMNYSGVEGRNQLVREICNNVGLDCYANLVDIRRMITGWYPLNEQMVRDWWKNDPYLWGHAMSIIEDKLPRFGHTPFGHVRDFAEETSRVRDLGGANVWGLQNTAFVFLNGEEVYRYSKKGNFHEEINSGADTIFLRGESSGAARIEGIKVGFEICLDSVTGTLSNLIRSRLKGSLDIHIVVSDYATNRAVFDDLLNEGGYRIHVSTHAAHQGVWRKVNGNLSSMFAMHQANLWGRILKFWIIGVEDNQGALADTFLSHESLADMTRRNPTSPDPESGETARKFMRLS